VLVVLVAIGSFSFAAIQQATKTPLVAGLSINQCQVLDGIYHTTFYD
jgi:hypothetical protein